MQTSGLRRPSVGDSAQYSAAPTLLQPTISTNVDAHRSNGQYDDSSPMFTTTPEALNFYRNTSSPVSGSLPSQSFDESKTRSASGPPLTAPRHSRSQPRLDTSKRSVKDIATQFDQASNGKIPTPIRPNGMRTVSALTSVPGPDARLGISKTTGEARTPRKLHKSPPQKRKSVDESGKRNNTLDSAPNSPTMDTSAQSRLNVHPTGPTPPFLFGEIDSHSPNGSTIAYGIPGERFRRGSEGSMHYPNAMFPRPRTLNMANSAAYNALRPRAGHTRTTSDSTAQSSTEPSRSHQSLQPLLPINFFPDLDRHELSQIPYAQSRLPVPSHRSGDTARRYQDRRPATPPQYLSHRQIDASNGQPSHADQRMRAFIRESSPKQSPPLRSSRPRQQVSSVSHVGGSSFGSQEPPSRSPSRGSFIEDQTYTPPEYATHLSRQNSEPQSTPGGQEHDSSLPQNMDPGASIQRVDHAVAPLQQLSNAVYSMPRLQLNVPGSFEAAEDQRPISASGTEGAGTDIEDDIPLSAGRNSLSEERDPSTAHTSVNADKDASWPKPPSLSIETHHGKRRKTPVLVADPGEPSPAMSLEDDHGETIHVMFGDSSAVDNGDHHPDDLHFRPEKHRKNTMDSLPETSSATPIQKDGSSYLSGWTPNSMVSPYAGRLTLDSRGYAMFDDIIQLYQESGAISPQMVEEVERHVIEPDTSISPQEVLQELIREGSLSYVVARNSPDEEEPRHMYHDVTTKVPMLGAHASPPSRLSNHTDIDDNVSTATDEERRDLTGPPPPLKDVVESPYVGSDDGTTSTATQRVDRFSAQTFQTTSSDRPSLPEIQDTGGGIGFFHGTAREGAGSDFASATSFPVELSAEQSRRHPSGSFSIASSDAQQAASSHGVVTPERPTQDTPPTSVSHPPSFMSTDHAVRSNSIDRDPPPPTEALSPSKDERRLNMRKNIINELINTEFSYHRDMTVVEDIYIATASSCDDLTADDVRVLFGNTAAIVSFSRQLADSLKEVTRGVYMKPKNTLLQNKPAGDENRASHSTSNSSQNDPAFEGTDEDRDRRTCVGAVFNKHIVIMEKIYSDYIKNHHAANLRLQKLKSSHRVKTWLDECHNYAKDLTQAWDLDSMLIKPTQRLLKYPLMLDEILKQTPEDHPDRAALSEACKNVKEGCHRTDEAKKRAELLEQVVNPRGKKDLDMGKAVQKAFGRRAEKLRQQVGMSEAFEDPDYRAIAQKFGSQHLQLQVAMKDVEMYRSDGNKFIKQYNDLAAAFEEVIDVGASPSPEIESKWRRWAMAVRELTAIAWADHVSSHPLLHADYARRTNVRQTAAVHKHCVEPMRILLDNFQRPESLMQKRKKRLADYAKYRTMKDRGEKPDKKTEDQGELFIALNESLKDELPKLFATSARLVEACLKNFVTLLTAWNSTWKRKLAATIDDSAVAKSFNQIIEDFNSDHQYCTEDVISLGICNGSLMNETANFLASTTSMAEREDGRPKRPSTLGSAPRKNSSASQTSPAFQAPDQNRGSAGSYTAQPYGSHRPSTDSAHQASYSNGYAQHQRLRSHSGSTPHRKPVGSTPHMRPPPIPNLGNGTFFFTPTPPLATAAAQSYEAASRQQQRPQHQLEQSYSQYHHQPQQQHARPSSSATYYTATGGPQPNATQSSLQSNHRSPASRNASVFSSAMPMSDNTNTSDARRSNEVNVGTALASPTSTEKPYKVLFLAASLFDFNIDRARTEAGYPYLTYLPGEIFDVIGEKGELWLAKNQDDATSAVGWIWEKHFAKLVSNELA